MGSRRAPDSASALPDALLTMRQRGVIPKEKRAETARSLSDL
jgi:hypothetical protein